VERKKYIGNDVAVVIFNEGTQSVDPSVFRSNFNHIFCIVRLDKSLGRTRYEVAFVTKKGVPSFGPQLPLPAVFEKGSEFREFLLMKLINAERAAMHAPQFNNRLRTRRYLLENVVQSCNIPANKLHSIHSINGLPKVVSAVLNKI